MYTGLGHEGGDPGLYHYACNLVPQPDGTIVQRPPFKAFGGTYTYTYTICGGYFVKRDGTVVNWRLTSTPEIQVYDPFNGWVTSVTAANFATATITVAAISGFGDQQDFERWAPCSDGTKDYIAFANGPSNSPFLWDGATGAGSLTELTNAPNSNRRPTLHQGKLIWIDAADERTIKWSEEYLFNTGYTSGLYTNRWTLAQTGSEPLTSILGTNEGLYYSRMHGVSIIRGAVVTDWATSGSRDAVADGFGTRFNLVLGGGGIWFVDLQEQLWFLPIGGVPEPVHTYPAYPDDPTALTGSAADSARRVEPFGYADFQYRFVTGSPVYVATWPGALGATIWLPITNGTGDLVGAGTDPTKAAPTAFVVRATGGREAIGWMRANVGAAVGAVAAHMQTKLYVWSQAYTVASGAVALRGDFIGIELQDSFGELSRMFVMGGDDLGGGLATSLVLTYGGGDHNVARTTQTVPYRFISGPMQHERGMEIGDAHCALLGKGTVTGTFAVISSRANKASVLTPTSWTVAFSSAQREMQMMHTGWEDEAVWARIMLAVSSSTLEVFGIDELTLDTAEAAFDESL